MLRDGIKIYVCSLLQYCTNQEVSLRFRARGTMARRVRVPSGLNLQTPIGQHFSVIDPK